VALRPSWDRNHYELLNGRILMNPPAEAENVTVLVRRGDRFDEAHCYERGDELRSVVLAASFAVGDLLP
jgi:hypothetical protein